MIFTLVIYFLPLITVVSVIISITGMFGLWYLSYFSYHFDKIKIGTYESMRYAYNELNVLFKKAGLTDESKFEQYLDVYHTDDDKYPPNELVWSVGTVIKDIYKEKQKLEEVGLNVVKLPKAKAIRVRIPCRTMLTYVMNIGRLFGSMNKFIVENGLKWKSSPVAYSKIGGKEFGILEYDVDEGWLFETANK